MSEAPNKVAKKQLEDLGIKLEKNNNYQESFRS